MGDIQQGDLRTILANMQKMCDYQATQIRSIPNMAFNFADYGVYYIRHLRFFMLKCFMRRLKRTFAFLSLFSKTNQIVHAPRIFVELQHEAHYDMMMRKHVEVKNA